MFEDTENNSYSHTEGFNDDIIRSTQVKVSVLRYKIVVHAIVIALPIVIFVLTGIIVEALRYLGTMDLFVHLYYVILISTLVIGIAFFINNVGKQMTINGKEIVFRRFFIIQETISVDEIEKVEVITGLALRTRYHAENFSKAIIHYGNGNKISFSDNLYSGWIDMVRYMTLNEKTFYKDGRSSIEQKLDDMLGK